MSRSRDRKSRSRDRKSRSRTRDGVSKSRSKEREPKSRSRSVSRGKEEEVIRNNGDISPSERTNGREELESLDKNG